MKTYEDRIHLLLSAHVSLTTPEDFLLRVLSRTSDGWINGAGLAQCAELSVRKLRGTAKHPGLVTTLSQKLLPVTGEIVIRRMANPAGYKLTDDLKEMTQAVDQWWKWLWNTKRSIDYMADAIKTKTNGQLELLDPWQVERGER